MATAREPRPSPPADDRRAGRPPDPVIVLRRGGDPVPWEPPVPTPLTGHDVAYWGGVLAAARDALGPQGLRFLVSFAATELPIEGDDVVVLEVGDDHGRVPRWSTRVLVTFKTMGTRPDPVTVPSRHPGAAAVALGLAGRERLLARRSAASGRRALRRGAAAAPVHELPLGYHVQADLPLRPIAERRLDLSFGGSVRHWDGWWGALTARLAPPKVYARRRMLEAVGALASRRPDLATDMRLVGAFFNVSPVTGRYDADNAQAYSEVVMDTKLLLAPQGANRETSRHFAGLRAGCVVVTDALPDRWYLRGAPFVVVSGWEALDEAVIPLLGDPDRLEHLHRASVRFWHERCEERRMGRWLAARITEAAAARRRRPAAG